MQRRPRLRGIADTLQAVPQSVAPQIATVGRSTTRCLARLLRDRSVCQVRSHNGATLGRTERSTEPPCSPRGRKSRRTRFQFGTGSAGAHRPSCNTLPRPHTRSYCIKTRSGARLLPSGHRRVPAMVQVQMPSVHTCPSCRLAGRQSSTVQHWEQTWLPGHSSGLSAGQAQVPCWHVFPPAQSVSSQQIRSDRHDPRQGRWPLGQLPAHRPSAQTSPPPHTPQLPPQPSSPQTFCWQFGVQPPWHAPGVAPRLRYFFLAFLATDRVWPSRQRVTFFFFFLARPASCPAPTRPPAAAPSARRREPGWTGGGSGRRSGWRSWRRSSRRRM